MWGWALVSVIMLAMLAGCTINLDGIGLGPGAIYQVTNSAGFSLTVGAGPWGPGATAYWQNPGTATDYRAYAKIYVGSVTGGDVYLTIKYYVDGAYHSYYERGPVTAGINYPIETISLGSGSRNNFKVSIYTEGTHGAVVSGTVYTYAIVEYTPTTTTTTATQSTTTQPTTTQSTTTQPTTTQSTTTAPTTTITTTTPGWATITCYATGGGSLPISNLQVNVYQDGGVLAHKSGTTDSSGKASFSVEPGHSYTVKASLDGVERSSGPTALGSGASWNPTLSWPSAIATTTQWTGTGTPPPATEPGVIDAGQFTGATTDTIMLGAIVLLFLGLVVLIRFRGG